MTAGGRESDSVPAMVSGVREVHSPREANALLKHRLRVAAPLLDPDSSLHPVPWSLPVGTDSSALHGKLVGHRYALQPADPMEVPALWDHGESEFHAPASFATGISEGPPAVHRVGAAVHRLGACLVEDAETAVRRGPRHSSVLEPGRDRLRRVARLGSAIVWALGLSAPVVIVAVGIWTVIYM